MISETLESAAQTSASQTITIASDDTSGISLGALAISDYALTVSATSKFLGTAEYTGASAAHEASTDALSHDLSHIRLSSSVSAVELELKDNITLEISCDIGTGNHPILNLILGGHNTIMSTTGEYEIHTMSVSGDVDNLTLTNVHIIDHSE